MRRIAVLVAASACLVAACDGGDQIQASSAPPVTSAAPEAVVFGDFAIEPIEDLVADFDLSHRGTEVHYLTVPIDALGRDSLQAAVEAGEPWGDVVTLDDDALAYATAQGLVAEAWPLSVEPVAMCYRADLLERAGLPSTRDGLGALLAENGGGWEQYFAVGAAYRQATGLAWFDDATQLWDAMVAQLPQGITVEDRESGVAADAELKSRWDLLGAALEAGLSANESPWIWSSGQALVDDSFATMPCSPATRSTAAAYVEVSAPGADLEWNVIDYFPGGGWSLSNAFVAVTATGADSDAAVELATWLGGAEAQSMFPSAGMGMPAEKAARQAWLDRGPDTLVAEPGAAQIDVARASAILEHEPGQDDAAFAVDVVWPLLAGIAGGTTTPDAAWQELVAALG